MGRQINFYMSENVQQNFIRMLYESDYIFLNGKGQVIEYVDEQKYCDYFLYMKKYGPISIKEEYFLDSLKSPVIQFSKTIIREGKIRRGRLWISNNQNTEGEKELVKDFNRLNRWIRKNVPMKEITKGDYAVKEHTSEQLIELAEKEGLAFKGN